MQFEDVTYVGRPADDLDLLGQLPPDLADVLRQTNGLIAFRGGLHLRGACLEPVWHSLRALWQGPESLASRYNAVRASDVPFAQDALGDQFLLRAGSVLRLDGETGELEPLTTTLPEFLDAACADPVAYLRLAPLLQFEAEGGRLSPGELLSAYPPFCTKESACGVALRALPAGERLAYLASLAAQLASLPDGARVKFEVTP